jgi:tetratricopeptide (TPR) repeat protein
MPASDGASSRRLPRFTASVRDLARWLVLALLLAVHSASATAFDDGLTAYRDGEFAEAAKAFAQSARQRPAAGTYVNLGLAEWERGRRGHAVLAWERALWIEPGHARARENLRFARQNAQLEAPPLAWHEVASTWLPVNAWAWLAGFSLWLAVGMMTVPQWLRRPRRGWHQAVAAAGLAVFLMCLPALFGLQSRLRFGIVLERNTPLRLTPTGDAQPVSMLAAGDPVRVERTRGDYLLVRSSHGRGWVERTQVGRLAGE